MRRLILRPALLLTILLTVFVTNIKAQDLNSATLLTRSEQYDKAEKMLQELIQNEPANSKYYFYLGENYLLDYYSDTISNSLTVAAKSAKEIYQKGVDANPNDPLNYVGLAKVAYFLDDDNTASEMRAKAKSFLLPYKKIKKISPPADEYAFVLAKLAESYIKNDAVDTSLALPLIRQALTLDRKSRDIYLIAGDIFILVNDGSNAIMNYNQAQFTDPQSPTANMKIGYIYVKGRAFQAAIPYFESAIELNESYAPAYRELGMLYSQVGRFDQSKENFQKYLSLTAGNIPAKTRYVTSLFYAKDYDGVIKNVEDIFAVDKSRTYMNRIAGYSCYEKTPPDYDMALSYMETLFQTVSPERIIKKDYHYLARILLKKNQDYTKEVDGLSDLNKQLNKSKSTYASSSTAQKAKLKAGLDDLTKKVENQTQVVKKADSEIDRAFGEFAKVLEFNPEDKNLLNEIANNCYNFRRYEMAARTWAKLLDPSKDNQDELMRIGRAYYTGDNYKTADSVFNVVIKKTPDYIPAYLWTARTYSKMDPDTKLGLAKPKFEKLLNVAGSDSVKNEKEIMEALGYLSYLSMVNDNYRTSTDYYNRMINLNPNSKEDKIRGYIGIASLESRMAASEKTIEGKLAYLKKAADSYGEVISLDPTNTAVKNSLKWVQEYQAAVKKGINPNEIKGTIKDTAGKPIAYASIRVKDTAAENLSGSNGTYKFEIPQGSEILIISADGYKSVEIPITKSRVYNITLEK